LLQPLLDFLAKTPGVRLVGRRNASERAPTVAFTVQGRSSSELAGRLGDLDLGVGVGNFYAYRLLQALGIDTDDGAVRVSFVHYTSAAEIGRLIEALAGLLAPAARRETLLTN
jgi:selenocysteine lyase/cysteine desulfurase